MDVTATTPEDPPTSALLDDYFAERAAGFPGGGYRVVRPASDAFREPGVLLRIDEDGVPLAVGGVRALPGGSGLRLEVKHLYVVPAGRGRGLGRRLLADLEAHAVAAGATELVLDTNRSLAAAGGLYRSAGFASVPPYNDNPNATDWYGKGLLGRRATG